MNLSQRLSRSVVLVLALLLVAGCTEIGNMQEQDKLHKPYSESPNFDVAAPELEPNAVPIGAGFLQEGREDPAFLQADTHFYMGMVEDELAEDFPPNFEITESVLAEGQRQYEGFCSPCHGYSGYGDGVLTQEGLIKPASFHTDDLRSRPVGSLYNTITNGQGNMFSYGGRISPENRWAIVAYMRALQLSEYAELSALSDDMQTAFEAATTDEDAAPASDMDMMGTDAASDMDDAADAESSDE